jgi:phosphohistidine phosphatase
MNIYLIRHGDAENISKGLKDFDRKLTHEGEQKINNAARYWQSIIPGFDLILSSPYYRALQTAKIIASVFNYESDIHTDRKLGCGSDTDDLIEIINSFERNDVAYIGHQPDLSNHTSVLISGNGAFVEFKKGAIAKISFHNKVKEGKGILEYLIPQNLFIPK